jgi:hypothetical protein
VVSEAVEQGKDNMDEEVLSFQDRLAMAKLNGFELFVVTGIIINDPCGPRRYAEYIAALNPTMAEEVARQQVNVQCIEDDDGNEVHGVLFVGSVLMLSYDERGRAGISVVDDGVYGDDPNREDGEPPEDGWCPPEGYEG